MAKEKQSKLAKEVTKHHGDNRRAVPMEYQNITKTKLKKLLPKNTSIAVTDEIVDLIRNMEEDTGLPQEMMEEDVMSYMHLLGNSTNGMKELVSAIKYCNLKRNYDNTQAWAIVFPDKYDRLVELGRAIHNHVSAYNGSKLVIAIDKEMLIPVHIQYAGYFHAAVKKQFELMNGTSSQGNGKTSPMVEHLAAKELAVLTAQPIDTKIDLKVTPSDAALSAQEEMNAQLRQIVSGQKARLASGESIIDVQEIGMNFEVIGQPNE